MAQKARFTWTRTPSSVSTMSPTALRSNASRARSGAMAAGSCRVATPTRLAELGEPAGGGLGGRATEGGAERGAQAARQRLEERVFRGEIDQLLGLDHVTRDGLRAAVCVGQSQL